MKSKVLVSVMKNIILTLSFMIFITGCVQGSSQITPSDGAHRKAYQSLYSECLHYSALGQMDITGNYNRSKAIEFCKNEHDRFYASVMAETTLSKLEFKHNTARSAARIVENSIFKELDNNEAE